MTQQDFIARRLEHSLKTHLFTYGSRFGRGKGLKGISAEKQFQLQSILNDAL